MIDYYELLHVKHRGGWTQPITGAAPSENEFRKRTRMVPLNDFNRKQKRMTGLGMINSNNE